MMKITFLGVTGHMLYWIMWEAVCHLEAINLKVQMILLNELHYYSTFMYVIVFICDSARPNRKFWKLLG